MSVNPLRNPVILSLDVNTMEDVRSWIQKVGHHVGAVKIGPRLINRYGGELIRWIAEKTPVFVDNKYFDIPSTMEAAVEANFEMGASLVTVHGLAGREALENLAKLEKKLSQQRPFRILAVTILTSWDQNSFPSNFKSEPVETHVGKIVEMAAAAGLRSGVASPHEIEILKKSFDFIVTPGLRMPDDAADDQKRTLTPAEAYKRGAHGLVIGRPLLKAQDPAAKLQQILGSLK